MTLPAVNTENWPVVSLGGFDWPVPPMTLKQNRKLQGLFKNVSGKILRDGITLDGLTEQDVADLSQIAFIALSRAHPQITVEEMDEMPIGVVELVSALLVVMEQSGLYRKTAAPGEAQGEQSPPIGT